MKNIFKKSFVVMFVLSFVFGGVLSSVKKVEAQTVVSIVDCAGLQNMKNNPSGNYMLANDIDCSMTNPSNPSNPTSMWADGAGFVPVGDGTLGGGNNFSGTLNGYGKKIKWLYINRPDTDFIGLFGYTELGFAVNNVGMEGVNITGNNDVGGLVGVNRGSVTNSYSTGSVNGNVQVGGLVGINNSNVSTITNSYSTVSVRANYLSGSNPSSGGASGLQFGGLLGLNVGGSIINSYSTGSVTGSAISTSSDIGGLVGTNNGGGSITNSFWDTQTSGQATSSGGTGELTSAMKDPSISIFTSAGWDFNTIWNIDGVTNNGYPFLLAVLVPKIIPDTTAPVGLITINNGAASTNSNSVTLNLSATDDVGVTGYFVSFGSTTPLDSDSGWVTVTSATNYGADVNFLLKAGDGTQSVYIWYEDAAGNVSLAAVANIDVSTSATIDTTIDSSPTDPSNCSSAIFTFSGSSSAGGAVAAAKAPAAQQAAAAQPAQQKPPAGSPTPCPAPAPQSTPAPVAKAAAQPAPAANQKPPAGGSYTFECSLDFSGAVTKGGAVAKGGGGATKDGFSSCSSPQQYDNLTSGVHTFSVRAIDQAGNVDQTPATFSWTINLDTDGDGVMDNVDQCPTVYGKVFAGCPFSDITVVTTHISGANSTGDCGLDNKGKKINECKVPTLGAIVKVFDRANTDFVTAYGTKQPKKNTFDNIFESGLGLIATCTTDSTGICQVGEDHGGKFIVITKLTDGVKVSYDGKFKDFKTQVRGNTDSSVDDADNNVKTVNVKYFTITKQVNFNKVINNNTTKYTSEAGDSFPDKQNNNQGNQNNNKGGKVSVAPQATSLWSAVKVAINGNPVNNDNITVGVKAVAQRNDIAIPEWGISGTTNSRTLSASILNALDLSFLSGFFK